MATTRVVVDPITRIEGHLRIEAQAENGTITNAWATSTQFRGIEIIMQGRDPRDAWVNAQASRGSRPCMMISMPRNCVEVAHALVIVPFSACASIRRWPSIRVIGSTTTLVVAMAASLTLRLLDHG